MKPQRALVEEVRRISDHLLSNRMADEIIALVRRACAEEWADPIEHEARWLTCYVKNNKLVESGLGTTIERLHAIAAALRQAADRIEGVPGAAREK